jgi:hypothetical protein
VLPGVEEVPDAVEVPEEEHAAALPRIAAPARAAATPRRPAYRDFRIVLLLNVRRAQDR